MNPKKDRASQSRGIELNDVFVPFVIDEQQLLLPWGESKRIQVYCLLGTYCM